MTAPPADQRDASIDGLRGVAVIAVVLGHALAFRLSFYVPAIPLEDALAAGLHQTSLYIVRRVAGPTAEAGVFLFFAISGYLITSLLSSEEERSGRVSLPAFYIRRACRILPPFLLYVAACIVARQLGWINFSDFELATTLLFLCNTGLECSWWFGHTWSLAIEEQFYLIWPLAFLLLPKLWRVPFLIIVLAVLSFIAVLALLQPDPPRLNIAGFSAIAMGSIAAISGRAREAFSGRASHTLFIGAVALLIVPATLWPYATAIPGLVPLAACYIMLCAGQLRIVRMSLHWKPLQLVGLSSYSVYLWQQFFLASPESYIGPAPNVLLILPVVALSVRFVESPFIRMGRMWSARWKSKTINDSNKGPIGVFSVPGEKNPPGGAK